MELDDLRSDWEKLSLDQGKQPAHLPDAGVQRHLTPVGRMLRNLRFETILLVVCYGFIIVFYFFAFRGMMQEISWFTIIIGTVFFIYYFNKYRLLKSLENMDGSLRDNVEEKLVRLSRYFRFYVWAGTLLGPITMGFVAWLAWTKVPNINPRNIFFPSEQNPLWKAILVWLCISIPFTVALYYVNRWYKDRLYGRHLRHLQRISNEMREDLSPNLQA
jgi:hypothetical protein